MAKCPRCGQRKGKRFCPALDLEICPICCAEERLVSIPCPPDCEHLAGEHYQHARRHRRAASVGRAFTDGIEGRFRSDDLRRLAFQLAADIYWWSRLRSRPSDELLLRGLDDAIARESPIYTESSGSTELGRYLSRLFQSKPYLDLQGLGVGRERRRTGLETFAAWVRELARGAKAPSERAIEQIATFFDELDFEADLDYSPADYLDDASFGARPAAEDRPRGLILP